MIRRKKRKYSCFSYEIWRKSHSQANTTRTAPHAYFLVDVQKISFFIKFWGSLKNIFLNVRVGSGFLHVILKLIHQEIIMCKSNSRRSCVEFPPNRTIVVHYIMTWWEEVRHSSQKFNFQFFICQIHISIQFLCYCTCFWWKWNEISDQIISKDYFLLIFKIRVFHFLMSDIGGGGHGKRW